MRYLDTFLPWIAFAVLSSFAWLGGALAALVVAVVLVVRKLRGGVAPDALILEGSTLLYFVVLSLVAALMPNSPIQPYVKVGSSAWLGLVAWTTLAGAGLIVAGCLIAARANQKLAEPIEAAM